MEKFLAASHKELLRDPDEVLSEWLPGTVKREVVAAPSGRKRRKPEASSCNNVKRRKMSQPAKEEAPRRRKKTPVSVFVDNTERSS